MEDTVPLSVCRVCNRHFISMYKQEDETLRCLFFFFCSGSVFASQWPVAEVSFGQCRLGVKDPGFFVSVIIFPIFVRSER